MAVAMLYCAYEATLRAFCDLNDLVDSKCVAVLITAVKRTIARRQRHLLTELYDFDVHDLALLIDHSQLVLMHLENETSVLTTIVEHKVVGFKAMTCGTLPTKHRMICV